MLTHESPTPSFIRCGGPPPHNATGALICEAGDPCAQCMECKERFLLTVDGYHPHLLDENRNFLFVNKDLYPKIDGGILYDWEPVTDCPNCHLPLFVLAG